MCEFLAKLQLEFNKNKGEGNRGGNDQSDFRLEFWGGQIQKSKGIPPMLNAINKRRRAVIEVTRRPAINNSPILQNHGGDLRRRRDLFDEYLVAA